MSGQVAVVVAPGSLYMETMSLGPPRLPGGLKDPEDV